MSNNEKQRPVDYKIFNDSVHGYIRLHPLCVKIIDTPEFQRLRNLKQLGAVYFVYPGASHNRFEHSLGVCHLAGKMVEAIRQNSNNELIINDEEKLCLEVAGLCRDLGHGPFSHIWERFVKAARSNNDAPVEWKHEESSVKMFDHLLKKNGLRSRVLEYFPNLEGNAIELIKELIKGAGTVTNKKYLYQIISNKENGISVNRWDYILRDSKQLNLSFSFDYSRLLKFCHVHEKENIICFQTKVSNTIYDMFQFRVNLYHKAYYHNVKMAVEEMIIDAFISANKEGYEIQGSNDRKYQLSEAHSDVEALSHMTDHIFYDILYNKNFEEARKLLHRILRRDLYKIVAYRNLSTDLLEIKERLIKEGSDIHEVGRKVNEEIRNYEQCIKENIKEISKCMEECKFEEFEVRMVSYGMGVPMKGASSPFRNISFCDKKNLGKAIEIEWKDIPVLPVSEHSMCHIHVLVIYKNDENSDSKNDENSDSKNDENSVSKNEVLQKELQVVEAELVKLWQSKSTAAK